MQREMVDRQHRSFELSEIEIRDADGGDGFTFEGVASTVDVPYTVRDRFGEFTEVIERGAFDKTLDELKQRASKGPKHDVALFINHDHKGIPLATVSSGRLELAADPNLRVKAHLNPARADVQTLRHAINDGELRQMSVGFNIPAGRNEWTTDGVHHIRETKLFEASIVWQGANHLTSAAMRSVDEMIADLEDADLDEVGLRRAIDLLTARLPAPTPVAAPVSPLLLEWMDKRFTA